MPFAPRPLEGVLVLDLSRETAGPFATMLLADMGAVVIKVEEPEQGDPSRWLGPPFYRGESPWFLAFNRNKRSLAVNVESAEGAQVVRRLAREATVLVEDFAPGEADRLGLGYAELSGENPGLVYVSVTGFGQTGPERETPASDLLIQALGGAMSLTGAPGGEPLRSGLPQADLVAGLLAVQGTLLALLARQRNERGQHVDVAALDGQVSMMSAAAAALLCTGQAPPRLGNGHAHRFPNGVYHGSDRPFTVAVETDMQWGSLCEVVGRPELGTDIRYASTPGRLGRRDEVEKELAPLFLGQTAEHWVSALRAAGVPAAPILQVPEVLAHPQVQARELLVEVDHPFLGRVQTVAHPVRLSTTPAQYEFGPPLLGEHSVEVLRAVLGMKDLEVDELLEREVIRQHGEPASESGEEPEASDIAPELTVSQEFALDVQEALGTEPSPAEAGTPEPEELPEPIEFGPDASADEAAPVDGDETSAPGSGAVHPAEEPTHPEAPHAEPPHAGPSHDEDVPHAEDAAPAESDADAQHGGAPASRPPISEPDPSHPSDPSLPR